LSGGFGGSGGFSSSRSEFKSSQSMNDFEERGWRSNGSQSAGGSSGGGGGDKINEIANKMKNAFDNRSNDASAEHNYSDNEENANDYTDNNGSNGGVGKKSTDSFEKIEQKVFSVAVAKSLKLIFTLFETLN
jgi:hypothetical protein